MKSILSPARTEEGKRIRKEKGDNGGIKFHEGRTLQVTQSYTSNTITSVQKDNLLLEVYSL